MQSHSNVPLSNTQIVDKLKVLASSYNTKKEQLEKLVEKSDSIQVISEADPAYGAKLQLLKEIEVLLSEMKPIQEEYFFLYKEFCIRNKIETY